AQPEVAAEPTVAQCRAVLAQALPRREPPRRLRFAQFVTALRTGAERQGCYAAILQKRRGEDVRVLSRLPLVGPEADDRPLLDAEGVPVRGVGERWHDGFPEAWQRSGLRAEALRLLPEELRHFVVNLLAELLLDPVDVLHCYVDDCNVVGAVAGCLAG